mgnify:CR=1 FL=1
MTIGYIGMGLVLAALLFGLVPGAPPLNAPKILDISEAAGVIDPAQMQAADVGTVIVRASYGTQADGAALGYVAQLAAGGIPVAALYHDFDPAAPWADQYEVLAAAMRQTSVRRAALRLSEPGLSPASSAAVAAFMARLASEFPLPLTYRHLIQTNAAACAGLAADQKRESPCQSSNWPLASGCQVTSSTFRRISLPSDDFQSIDWPTRSPSMALPTGASTEILFAAVSASRG